MGAIDKKGETIYKGEGQDANLQWIVLWQYTFRELSFKRTDTCMKILKIFFSKYLSEVSQINSIQIFCKSQISVERKIKVNIEWF